MGKEEGRADGGRRAGSEVAIAWLFVPGSVRGSRLDARGLVMGSEHGAAGRFQPLPSSQLW